MCVEAYRLLPADASARDSRFDKSVLARMLIFAGWLLQAIALTLSSAADTSSLKDNGLFLTPLILNRNLQQARNASKVDFFMEQAGVDAYSGYITVQEKSHMFFLFLKAPKNISNQAPLIVWLEGGPGKSGLFAQFLENGPVGIDANGKLYNRSCTFQKDANILYIDSPAGGGFSIIQNASVLSRTLQDVTKDLERFLVQFFTLFSETKSVPLYVAGHSYGARAAVSLSKSLRAAGTHPPAGVILSAGFLPPLTQSVLKSEEFLYHLGLVDTQGRETLARRFQLIQNISMSNTTAAILLLSKTVFNLKIDGQNSMFENLTGYSDQDSILHPTLPRQITKYVEYVNSTAFKRKLHIHPNAKLDGFRLAVTLMLGPNDFFANIDDAVTSVLDSEKVLMMNGQMDDIFPPDTFERYLRSLNWTLSPVFNETTRKPWHTFAAPSELAGYVTETDKLVNALVLKGGHSIGIDACDSVYDLVYRFLNNVSYSETDLLNATHIQSQSKF